MDLGRGGTQLTGQMDMPREPQVGNREADFKFKSQDPMEPYAALPPPGPVLSPVTSPGPLHPEATVAFLKYKSGCHLPCVKSLGDPDCPQDTAALLTPASKALRGGSLRPTCLPPLSPLTPGTSPTGHWRVPKLPTLSLALCGSKNKGFLCCPRLWCQGLRLSQVPSPGPLP